ncbi:hypothetical protein J3R82DRAFT_5787 [Butyriboletus roseoflavus]|nr:hypothetical protein J3R82DRAFT_5787 [Butyriboletus roseoflavus]
MNLQGGDGSNRPCLHSQDYFSRRRNLKELLHSKDDDWGYIEGKVFMIWPPRNRLHRINLEVVEEAALYRFELEVPHKDGFTFRPHERVRLALKGVRVDRRKESSAPHYFPIVLRFPHGVVLKYLSGANAGKVIDTLSTGNTDEWYNPGMIHTVSDTVTIDASEIRHGPVPTITCPPMPTPPQRDVTSRHGDGVVVDRPSPPSIAVADGTATAQSTRPAQQPSTERHGRSSKARARKKRRLHKEKESTFPNQLANDTDGPPPADAATPCHGQPQASGDSSSTTTSDSHPKAHQVSGHTNGEAFILEGSVVDLSRENNHSNTMTAPGEAGIPALRLKAGILTQRGDTFTALSDLQNGSMINVIGIVASVTPEKKTTTNGWSIIHAVRFATTAYHSKLFSKEIPRVAATSAERMTLLFCVVEFNGALKTTGYGDKLRWAVYDPLGHSIKPPSKGNAPENELLDDGMSYEFSPFWEPFQDSIELQYCRQIGEWWKARHELEGQNVSTVEYSRPPPKQHLLISESSPDHPPRGFFNCTVEVLQKFNNHGGATTVYVTDYTTSALIRSVQAPWCPPELSDCVLQCDMWDDARNIAKMMNPGEFWYLHNVRAKWNPSHYMEGTMQLAEKVTQLDETKVETQPHLKALLARKKEFELNKSSLTSGSGSLHIFPDMLLQDVEGSTTFFTCIVEPLHFDLNSRDGHFIYVTDYTYNPDLPTTVSTADWAYNLEHRVVKIKLDDTQAKTSLDLRPGSMYIIHNLRIKRLNVSGGMHGCLGGEDTLIVSLHDSSSHRAQALQRNKEKWQRENMLNVLTTLPNESHGETHGLLGQSSTILDNTTFQEVLARPAPSTFRVLARAMDFFPFSLEDASVLRCTKCESSPPPSFKGCPRCDDMMETHSKWFYRLYILLQDEEGSELIVSLSGKECTLLQDVNPTDFRCDQVAFRRLLAKLNPILGNLRDVHVAWSRDEHKVIQSPLMMFTLESWDVGDARGYGLLDCIPK